MFLSCLVSVCAFGRVGRNDGFVTDRCACQSGYFRKRTSEKNRIRGNAADSSELRVGLLEASARSALHELRESPSERLTREKFRIVFACYSRARVQSRPTPRITVAAAACRAAAASRARRAFAAGVRAGVSRCRARRSRCVRGRRWWVRRRRALRPPHPCPLPDRGRHGVRRVARVERRRVHRRRRLVVRRDGAPRRRVDRLGAQPRRFRERRGGGERRRRVRASLDAALMVPSERAGPIINAVAEKWTPSGRSRFCSSANRVSARPVVTRPSADGAGGQRDLGGDGIGRGTGSARAALTRDAVRALAERSRERTTTR